MFQYDDITSASLYKQENNRNSTVCVHARAAFSISLMGYLSTSYIRTRIYDSNILSAREDELTNNVESLTGHFESFGGPQVAHGLYALGVGRWE